MKTKNIYIARFGWGYTMRDMLDILLVKNMIDSYTEEKISFFKTQFEVLGDLETMDKFDYTLRIFGMNT